MISSSGASEPVTGFFSISMPRVVFLGALSIKFLPTTIGLCSAVGLLLWGIQVFFRRSSRLSDFLFLAVMFLVVAGLSYTAKEPKYLTI